MAATIKDIARLAGVSHTTVSQVLNNKGRISKKKRKEIREICERENFVPNQLARSLQVRETKALGVILNFFGNPFFSEIISGIENVANKNNYVLLFGDARELPERESMYINTFLERRVDGIILYPTFSSEFENDLIKLKLQKTPFVLVDRFSENIDTNVVACDDVLGGKLATEHLLKLGHKKIGIILGPPSSTMNRRLQGYRETMQKHGIPENHACVAQFEISKQNNVVNGYNASLEILNRPDRPTALFVTTDEAVPGTMRAARELNLSVPDDLALVAYGNMKDIVEMDVPLTSVNYPKTEVGEEAMKLLLEMMKKDYSEEETKQIVLKPELVIRKSCGYQNQNQNKK